MRKWVTFVALVVVIGLAPQARADARVPSSGSERASAYPALAWIPASPYNYWPLRSGSRPQYIVIHDTEISFTDTISAFQNPRSRVSAHYVIRGYDGYTVQMVADWDEAWHTGTLKYNREGIGIEHELNRITNPAFTPVQYQASARLSCAIADKYSIPLDRAHIIGHNEVPWPNTHTDPGWTWNWPYYMGLLRSCGEARLQPFAYHSRWAGQQAPASIALGDVAAVTVTLRNAGDAPWRKGTSSEVRLGIPNNDGSAYGLGYGLGWALPSRPAVQAEDVVAPGDAATFRFLVKGARLGTVRVDLQPVIDGVKWLEAQGIYVELNVR